MRFQWVVVQLSCCVWLCVTHGLQHARPPCPSPSPEVCPSSCRLHRWCHPAISSSDTLFSFCPQSFPAPGIFLWVSCLHQMTKTLEFQLQQQSFQWIFRDDCVEDWQYHIHLITIALWYSLKSRSIMLPHLCSSFSRVIWICRVICGSMQILVLYILFFWRTSWNFDGDCIESVDCFE